MSKISNIIKNIRSFPRVWKAARLIEEAWNLYASNDLVESEKKFAEGEKLLTNLTIEYKIMKGDIKFKLKKREECMRIFMSAWQQLSCDDNFSIDDKLYLKEHIYSAIKIYKSYGLNDFVEYEPVTPNDVPLKNVSTVWKRRFPCRDHPEWKQYGV